MKPAYSQISGGRNPLVSGIAATQAHSRSSSGPKRRPDSVRARPCKPQPRDKLKTEGCSKRGLTGDQRMALVFCRPAADDGSNKVLDNEGAPMWRTFNTAFARPASSSESARPRSRS